MYSYCEQVTAKGITFQVQGHKLTVLLFLNWELFWVKLRTLINLLVLFVEYKQLVFIVNLKRLRSSRSQISLKISQYSQENTCIGVSF